MGGAESQDRTGDTAIFSRVLYQLSYLGPMVNQPSAARRRVERYHGPRRGHRGLGGWHRPKSPGARSLSPEASASTSPIPRVQPRQAGRLAARERRLAGQLAESIDPVEDRRMGVHQARRARLELLDRVREVHVLRAAVGDLEDLLVGADLGQRPLEAVGVAGQLDGRRIGEVLALAADRELDEAADDRGQDRQHDGDDRDDRRRRRCHRCRGSTTPTRQPAPEREAQEEVGEDGDRADHHPDDEREPDVEVPDVRQLVGDDALELLAIELLEEAGRDRDRRVRGIAAGGERVRRRVVDGVDRRASARWPRWPSRGRR